MLARLAMSCAAVICFAAAPASAAPPAAACDLGTVLTERTLLTPRADTFYSVDSLNPDVVKRGSTYFMFFSGNDVHTPAGDWRTGVATATRPGGPFRVRNWLRGNFLNGGTAVWRGRFWQAYSHNRRGGELAVSSDARHWRRVSAIPDLSSRGWPVSADYFVERRRAGLRVYMLVRSSPVGLNGSLASIDWRHGRWGRFRVLLSPGRQPWENADLGEPATIGLPDRRLLLYTATASADAIRSIGLAVRDTDGSWARCGTSPLIAPGAAWGPAISIDPSPLREGRRLYVYYGAGTGNSIASDLDGAIGVRVYALPGASSRGLATPSKNNSSSSIRRSQPY